MLTLDEKSLPGVGKKALIYDPHPLLADSMGTLLALLFIPSRPSLPSFLSTKATSTAAGVGGGGGCKQHTQYIGTRRLPHQILVL